MSWLITFNSFNIDPNILVPIGSNLSFKIITELSSNFIHPNILLNGLIHLIIKALTTLPCLILDLVYTIVAEAFITSPYLAQRLFVGPIILIHLMNFTPELSPTFIIDLGKIIIPSLQ